MTALFLAAHWRNGWAVIEIKGVLDAATARDLRDFAASVMPGGAPARAAALRAPVPLTADAHVSCGIVGPGGRPSR